MKDPIAETRATYDTVARDYARTYEHDLDDKILDRALLGALVESARRLSGGASPHIGDLGCGPGFEARWMAERGARVRGIDLAPGMVEEARRRHPGVTGLSFGVGSLLELPFEAASLDGALAMYSIIHLHPNDRQAAYREMARVLRPGAALLLSIHTSAEGNPAGSCRRLEEWWGHPVALSGYFIDAAEVTSALTTAGFRRVAILERGPTTEHEYPSQRAYLLMTRT